LGSQQFRDRFKQVVDAHRDEIAQLIKKDFDLLSDKHGLLG